MHSAQKKVVIIDDSAVSRSLISNSLNKHGNSQIIGSFEGFKNFANDIYSLNPDIIILDQMLKDEIGTECIPLLKSNIPTAKIVLVSALSPETDSSLREALLDSTISFVQKPNSSNSENSVELFSQNLVDSFYYKETFFEESPIELRPFELSYCNVIAIAGSTGSPQALLDIFSRISVGEQRIPIFITIHISPDFTQSFAEELSSISGLKCLIPNDGDVVRNDTIYLAPPNLHLGIKLDSDTNVVINLLDTPPENFCKPAADPMLRSLSKIYRSRLLAIIITGMGYDGLKGSEEVIANGGTVVTQDEESSAVFGMAKAVAQKGLSSKMLSLNGISNIISRYI